MTKKRLRIGILGGSFDPVHVGHLSVAQQVAGELRLDEVILVPAGRPPHKSKRRLAPAADRLEMVRRAARGLARLSVSDLEIEREGPSYSLDTVRRLKEQRGAEHEYFFIIGADTVGELPTWHRATELLEEVNFAIAERPGAEANFAAVEKALGPDAAGRLRGALVPIDPCEVSSTEIRRRLAAGESISGLVRADVVQYMEEKKLYH